MIEKWNCFEMDYNVNNFEAMKPINNHIQSFFSQLVTPSSQT